MLSRLGDLIAAPTGDETNPAVAQRDQILGRLTCALPVSGTYAGHRGRVRVVVDKHIGNTVPYQVRYITIPHTWGDNQQAIATCLFDNTHTIGLASQICLGQVQHRLVRVKLQLIQDALHHRSDVLIVDGMGDDRHITRGLGLAVACLSTPVSELVNDVPHVLARTVCDIRTIV